MSEANHSNLSQETKDRLAKVKGSGTEAAQELQEVTSDTISKIRIFRSRVPNSRFIFSTGKEIFFTLGWYETSDELEIKELDAVANRVPTIFTDEHEKEVISVLLEARKKGFTGNLGDLMNAEISIEARLKAIAMGPGGLPSPVPAMGQANPGLLPALEIGPSVDVTQTLREAIKNASAQSNG